MSCACCGGGCSCCDEVDLPETLVATFSSVDCPCLDGYELILEKVGTPNPDEAYAYEKQETPDPCEGVSTFSLYLFCSSGLNIYDLFVSCGFHDDVDTPVTCEVSSCNPFMLVLTVQFNVIDPEDGGLCCNEVFTITITEPV